MTAPVAWLVIGEPRHRSLHFDHERAMMQAVAYHGIVKPLVLEEEVIELVRAAFNKGAERGDSRRMAQEG